MISPRMTIKGKNHSKNPVPVIVVGGPRIDAVYAVSATSSRCSQTCSDNGADMVSHAQLNSGIWRLTIYFDIGIGYLQHSIERQTKVPIETI